LTKNFKRVSLDIPRFVMDDLEMIASRCIPRPVMGDVEMLVG
jgi:hypothetical protein